MAFYFALGTVLRVRGIVEDQEERTLQGILFKISQTRDTMNVIDEDINKSNMARIAEFLKPSLGMNVHAFYGELEELRCRKVQCEEQIKHLEEQRDKQLLVYEKAHRDREMLTDMRDQSLSAYQFGRTREEQKNLDDIFIARRSRC